ncbi:hypothetical protein HPB49_014431 [Dermacentor silvarum]|uniref:Uncharacterized protein n=1 Tax=Dermacentor silvarum TaxID=543639 RepID=A0ACB8CLC1_DERSI|nr:ubiquitin-conjugating enzyme E2 Z [Dermacentor silvarum]KAH7945713.1 hypothetical protein HPB49_014431 [Dermacentor silvarum]
MAHIPKESGDGTAPVTIYGPGNHDMRSPSPLCLLRTKRDLADLEAKPIPGVFLSPEEKDVTKIHVLMVGPAGTPYEGGFFHLFIECGGDYPMQAPSVRLLTTDAGRVQFHPHIYSNGRILLGSSWTPVQSIGSLLASILSLLRADAYSVGNLSSEAYQEAIDRYNSYVQHETLRVAVCDTVEACLQDNSAYPRGLAELIILQKFVGSYSRYKEIIEANLHLSGTEMKSFTGLVKGTFEYGTLLARLEDLLQRLKSKYGTNSTGSV